MGGGVTVWKERKLAVGQVFLNSRLHLVAGRDEDVGLDCCVVPQT